MKAFLFECKKIIKKKSAMFALFLSILAVIGLFIFNYSVAKGIEEGNSKKFESLSEIYINFANDAKEEKEKAIEAGDTETAEEMERLVSEYQLSSEKTKQKKIFYENREWKIFHERDLDNLQVFIDNPDTAEIRIEEQPISYFTLRATYEETKILNEIDSKPYIQNTINQSYLPTIYDNLTGSSLKQWETQTKRYAREGFSFLVQLIQFFYIPAIVLIGCFIFGNNISSESTKKQRGMNFYRVLPYSKVRFFFAKYISGYLYLFIFSIIMIATPLICSLFTNSLGSIKNPILVYEGSTAPPSIFGNYLNELDDQFHFIEMNEYFWKVALFFIVFSFFMYTFYFLLALLIKNSTITFILLSAITYIGMKVFPASEYNPFIYTDIHRIINGELATLTFNPEISYSTGVILYLVIGVILLILGYLKFHFNRKIA